MATTVDVRQYVATSADAAVETTRWLEQAASDEWRLVDLGHKAIDDEVALYPGSLTAVLGRPSMGKSMLCKWLAKREADRIAASGNREERVIYVTLEESVPVVAMAIAGWGLTIQDVVRGRFEIGKWRVPAARIAELPLMFVRHPGLVAGKVLPKITPQMLYESIEWMCEHFPSDPKADRIRPTLVVLDYVQLLNGDDLAMTDRSKTAQVTAAIEGAKRLAMQLDVPVVMAVQAGRQTDSRSDYMPTMSDAQWASAIEQACDVVLGVHRPIRRDDLADQVRSGTPIHAEINGRQYVVNDSLMVIGLVKQRAGTGAGRYPVYLDPARLQLFETMPDIALGRAPVVTYWQDR